MSRENQLSIDCQVSEQTSQLDLEGELVAETRFEPERVLRELLDQGVSRVIVGCRRLCAIDSAGLSTLLGAMHRFRRKGGDLILADMNPALNAIFTVTSMQRYFKIYPTQAEALEHFENLKPPRKKRSSADAEKKGTK